MSKNSKIAINVIALLAIIAYMVVTFVTLDNRAGEVRFARLDISVQDSGEVQFVVTDSIRQMIFDSVAPLGIPLVNIHLADIEGRLRANQYIDSVEVHAAMDGVVTVRLIQHRPLMRVFSQSGYNFLVDSALHIMEPVAHYHPKVPIISGMPHFDFATDFYGRLDRKKYSTDAQNIKKLINFVQLVASDEFLDRLCAQIFVTRSGQIMEVEIIPAVGRSIIKVGELDDCRDKLSKVKAFYRSAYSYAGLDTAHTVDIRFKDQILVR